MHPGRGCCSFRPVAGCTRSVPDETGKGSAGRRHSVAAVRKDPARLPEERIRPFAGCKLAAVVVVRMHPAVQPAAG